MGVEQELGELLIEPAKEMTDGQRGVRRSGDAVMPLCTFAVA